MTIRPLNENAALVSFENRIDLDTNQKVIALDRILHATPFSGFIETAPAYSSLAVFYDINQVKSTNPNCETAFDFVKEYIEINFKKRKGVDPGFDKDAIGIPVLYDGEDLGFVSNNHQLTKEEAIAIHSSMEYRVFMIGFLPGFAYMGTLDERIATPRKSSPRMHVPAGSIGIAGLQTGIYPQASPGGWQLIGRTPLKIFRKEKPEPCLFSPGDRVHFYSINQNEFEHLNEY